MPRDRYGRPLPAGEEGFPGVPERADISAAQAWEEGVDYLARDLPFHAHEVFEQRWRCCPLEERDLWQALAQWGAALTHLARGNHVGAVAVAERALERLDRADIVDPVDATHVRASLRAITDDT